MLNTSWQEIDRVLNLIPYKCSFKLITGLKCAFCGMTHSWIALLRGEVAKSFEYNALGPIVFVGAVFFILMIAFKKTKWIQNQKRSIMIATILILSAFLILRNIFSF